MIENELQYRVTKDQLDKFETSLTRMLSSENDGSDDDLFSQAMIDAMRSQMSDLKDEISEYEARRDRGV